MEMRITMIDLFARLRLGFVAAILVLASGCATRSVVPPAPPVAATPEYRYVIGPGDSLQIVVWRNPELSTGVTVRSDGIVSVPLVEDLEAIGRTPTQLAREIEQALSKYIQSPIVTVLTGGGQGPTTEQIRILGAATRPSSFPYVQNMTLVDVMIRVGGISDYADGNGAKILRTREGNKVYSVRLRDLLREADLTANVDMKPGDILIIPESWF
jgi:polysaccharide export outer membrane protein